FLEEPVTATHECDREISGAVPEAGTSRVIDPIPPIRSVNIVRESGSFKLPVEDTIRDLVGKTLQNSKVGKGLDSRGPVVIQRLQNLGDDAGVSDVPTDASGPCHVRRFRERNAFIRGVLILGMVPPRAGVEIDPEGVSAFEIDKPRTGCPALD